MVSLSPSTVDQALDDVRRVAEAAGIGEHGKQVAATLRNRLDVLGTLTAPLAAKRRPRVLHLEWLEPPMPAGMFLVLSAWPCCCLGICCAGGCSISVLYRQYVLASFYKPGQLVFCMYQGVALLDALWCL